MLRREFIALLGGTAVLWPFAARAQQERVQRVGVLMATSDDDSEGRARVRAFVIGLRDLGLIDGRNVRLDYRWAGTDVERLRASASELVAQSPTVILAGSSPTLAALRYVKAAIPIVFVLVSDPVGQGFVQSLAHPGANVTGFTNFEFSAIGKWAELLKEIAPDTKRIAVIFNPDTAPYTQQYLNPFETAARALAVEPTTAPVHTDAEIESTITGLGQERGSGVIVMSDPFTLTHRSVIISLAARYRVPVVYPFRYFAAEGGLLSYGVDTLDLFRRSASYVDRILKGTSPADLPVQQPTKFDLVINLKTAKTFGLSVPPTLLALADEVIE
jgi:putative tryptophan/tyrosine transport system substrate-binding protein